MEEAGRDDSTGEAGDRLGRDDAATAPVRRKAERGERGGLAQQRMKGVMVMRHAILWRGWRSLAAGEDARGIVSGGACRGGTPVGALENDRDSTGLLTPC